MTTYKSLPKLFWPYSSWKFGGSKNENQKNTCLKEDGLHAQNTITIIGSIIHIMGGDLYDHSMCTIIFILIVYKVFMWSMKIMKVAMASTGISKCVQFHITGEVGQPGNSKHSKPIYLNLLPLVPLIAPFSNAMSTIGAVVAPGHKKVVHLFLKFTAINKGFSSYSQYTILIQIQHNLPRD
jgi:hypothetical protein